jgi:hypothetical protein
VNTGNGAGGGPKESVCGRTVNVRCILSLFVLCSGTLKDPLTTMVLSCVRGYVFDGTSVYTNSEDETFVDDEAAGRTPFNPRKGNILGSL